jgi:Na+-transporting NADH:ubiquinone oxidoreductase subunit NqrB
MLDGLPNARLAVYIFLEMIALGFALEAVAALMRGDGWWKWTGALILGAVFMVLGVKSVQIVERCSRYLNARLIWMAVLAVFSLYLLYFLHLSVAVPIMNLHQRMNGVVG